MSIRLLKGQSVAGSVIYCHYCDAVAENETVAACEGWLSGVWDNWELVERPVCPACKKARCVRIRGEYHLEGEACEKADRPKQIKLFDGKEGESVATLEPHAAGEFVQVGADLDAVARLVDLTIARLEQLKADPLTVSDLRTSRQKLRSVQRQLKLTVHQAERVLRVAPQEQQQQQA